MIIRAVVSIGVIAILWGSASPCFSQETPPPKSNNTKVVVLQMASCCAQTAWPAAEAAVAEELETIDLQVKYVEGTPIPAEALKASLGNVAKENSARVVIHLSNKTVGAYRADILTTHPNETPTLEHLYFQTIDHSDGLQTAALRIVETVRVLLFASESSALQADPHVAPKEPVRDEYRVGVGVGFASAYSPGGVPVSMGIDTNIHSTFATYLLLELDFTWAFYTKDISYSGEKATFDMMIVRANLFWNMIPTGKIHPALGVGGGVLIGRSGGRSDTDSGIGNYNEKKTVAYLGVAGRLAIDISTRSAFVLNGKGGFLAPPINIYLREQLAATYGRPLLELLCGFEFRFF